METLELKSLGLQELDSRELKESNGGGWLADFISNIICGCGIYKWPEGGISDTWPDEIGKVE